MNRLSGDSGSSGSDLMGRKPRQATEKPSHHKDSLESIALWEFKPYRSVGPLKFGMTVAQVKAILGAPKATKTTSDNITEMRGTFKLIYDAPKGKLFSMNFQAPTPFSVGGSLLFGEKDPIALLSKLDKETKEGGGYVNFMGLGLLAGGFGKKRIPEGKLLIAYSKAKLKVYTYFTEV